MALLTFKGAIRMQRRPDVINTLLRPNVILRAGDKDFGINRFGERAAFVGILITGIMKWDQEGTTQSLRIKFHSGDLSSHCMPSGQSTGWCKCEES